MLALLGWVVLVLVAVYFTIVGGALLFVGAMFGEWQTKLVGAVVLVCALTGMYNVSKVSPFSITVDTHVYQEHK